MPSSSPYLMHWRARQGEHEAVGQPKPPFVAVEHGREAAANAAIVELHARLGPERFEDRLALFLRQAPEVELVMISEEHTPLSRRGARAGFALSAACRGR